MTPSPTSSREPSLGLGAYRNADDVARARRDEAAKRWREQVAGLDEALLGLYGRRVGRIAFGMVALFGFTVMAVSALTGPGVQTRILGLSWLAMLLAYVGARAVATRQPRRWLDAPLRYTADPWADLERLEKQTPRDILRRRIVPLEHPSAAWPLVGMALLAALGLHLLVYLLLDGNFESDDFDEWIILSVMTVGHGHVILACRGWRFAHRLGESDGWKSLGWVVLSCVFSWLLPGTLYGKADLSLVLGVVLATMVIVFLTGVLYVPLMFGWMRKRIHAERDVLG